MRRELRSTKKGYRSVVRDGLAGFSLLDLAVSAEQASLRVRLLTGSPYLDGHFPGEAILPGVAQIALALHAGTLLRGGALALGGVKEVRFRRPLRPEDEFEVVVMHGDADDEVRFEVRVGSAKAGTGILKVSRLANSRA
jgi:3-hydroxymyristoyl/3-hydroxydecanoyl-(acyl carrier protein) dehydratase